MNRLSSDWTLFYKVFLPNVWIVFFGAAIGIFAFSVRLPFLLLTGVVLLYLCVVAVLWFTLLRLKRVEEGDGYVYVTNYFKTFRYTLGSIGKITSIDVFLFKVIILHFPERTSFGRRITFIRRRIVWEEFLQKHEQLMKINTKP